MLAGFFEHQLRWSRSTRDSRRWGYTGLVFTFGLPWAFLNLIAAGLSLESIALFVLALLVRVALALVVGVGILGDTQVLRDLLLLLPRDLIALVPLGLELRRRHRHLARRTLPPEARQTHAH